MSKWLEKPLGQLAKFQKGRKVETSEYDQDGYDAYLGASALEGNVEGYASTALAVRANPSDVLMLWDGERSGLVGHNLSGVVSSTVSRITPNTDITGPYLYYHLSSRFEWIQGRRTGTGVPHVPKDLSRILKVYYPREHSEQNSIVAVLATADAAIRKTESLIAKYQQIKAGLMHDLFTRGVTADGKLRPPREQAPELYHETPIGWIPKEWNYGPLAKFLTGGPKNGYSPREVDEWRGCYALGLGCLTMDGFRPVQLKMVNGKAAKVSGAFLSDGDLLVSRSNTSELVGLCGIYRDIGSPCIYPDLMMRIRPNASVASEYLEQLLLNPATRKRLTALAVGTSGSMVKLNAISLLSVLLSVPSDLSEQYRILAILAPSRELINRLEVEKIKLLHQKMGLMHDLLTGKVRVIV